MKDQPVCRASIDQEADHEWRYTVQLSQLERENGLLKDRLRTSEVMLNMHSANFGADVDSLMQTVDSLEVKLSEQKQSREMLEGQVAIHKGELRFKNEEISELQRLLKESQGQVERLKKEVETSKRVQTQLEISESINETLHREKEELFREKERLERQLSQVESTQINQQKTIERLEGERRSLLENQAELAKMPELLTLCSPAKRKKNTSMEFIPPSSGVGSRVLSPLKIESSLNHMGTQLSLRVDVSKRTETELPKVAEEKEHLFGSNVSDVTCNKENEVSRSRLKSVKKLSKKLEWQDFSIARSMKSGESDFELPKKKHERTCFDMCFVF